MDVMRKTLDLSPFPAALFTEDRDFVAHNYAMGAWGASRFPEERRTTGMAQEICETIGLDLVGHDPHRGTTEQKLVDNTIAISSMLPARHLPRPELILVTLHVPSSDAWQDHQRVLLSVQVNESGERALQALEHSMVQINAAMEAQRELLGNYNQRAQAFFSTARLPETF